MTIKSMTGFGKGMAENDNLLVQVELKALNGKNLDLNIRLPKSFQQKELLLRKLFQDQLDRGSVQAFFTIEMKNVNPAQYEVNKELVKHYYQEISKLGKELGDETNGILSKILSFPDILSVKENDEELESNWLIVLDATQQAIDNMNQFREHEGAVLGKAMADAIHVIQELLVKVESLEHERINAIRNRIKGNLEEFIGEGQVDQNRFEQELIYFLEKIDIAEEKTRLRQHCAYFLENLHGENAGRKLGFISQEIGREINTMGSKANHVGIQQAVINMKEELEKIKEQGLNIL
jgi:uncharacterized protein (TIGR00255 family)